MSTAQAFLARIEAFLDRTGTQPTTLGREAMGDPNFVFDLRSGRVPNLDTVDRVDAHMAKVEADLPDQAN